MSTKKRAKGKKPGLKRLKASLAKKLRRGDSLKRFREDQKQLAGYLPPPLDIRESSNEQWLPYGQCADKG